MGLTHYWVRPLDENKSRSITEIASAKCMDVGQTSRIARLVPRMVEVCLAGDVKRVTSENLFHRAVMVDWQQSRHQFCEKNFSLTLAMDSPGEPRITPSMRGIGRVTLNGGGKEHERRLPAKA